MLAGASTVTEKFKGKKKKTRETKERFTEIKKVKEVSCARVQKPRAKVGKKRG